MKRVQKKTGCDIIANKLTVEDVRENMIGKKYKITTTCDFFPELSGQIMTVASAVYAKTGELLIQCRNHYGRLISLGANMKDLTFHECTCFEGC